MLVNFNVTGCRAVYFCTLRCPTQKHATTANLTDGSPPKAGDVWRAQLNRWDGSALQNEPRQLSMWCHSGIVRPHPHNPERFGYLHFK
jgi:hypothetical protein